MSDNDLLCFPSGRSVSNCRKDAKRLSREMLIPLNQAQDRVAEQNGLSLPWGKAMERLPQLQRVAESKPGFPEMTRADVEAVMKRRTDLTHYGIGIPMRGLTSGDEIEARYRAERDRLVGALDECNKALRFLAHTTKRKTLNPKRSSYGLKHSVSSQTNPGLFRGAPIIYQHIFLKPKT